MLVSIVVAGLCVLVAGVSVAWGLERVAAALRSRQPDEDVDTQFVNLERMLAESYLESEYDPTELVFEDELETPHQPQPVRVESHIPG